MLHRLVFCVLALSACGNRDPEGAEALWDDFNAADYRAWARPPGYEGRTPSATVHGGAVDIFVNDVVADALAGGAPLSGWPDGALIVKDGYTGEALQVVLAMEKRGQTWFFAEYEPDGEVLYSGAPRACTRCHEADNDRVLAFALP